MQAVFLLFVVPSFTDLLRTRFTNLLAGRCTLIFSNPDDARTCVKEMDGATVDGFELTLRLVYRVMYLDWGFHHLPFEKNCERKKV